jgi:hypothetical protein
MHETWRLFADGILSSIFYYSFAGAFLGSAFGTALVLFLGYRMMGREEMSREVRRKLSERLERIMRKP